MLENKELQNTISYKIMDQQQLEECALYTLIQKAVDPKNPVSDLPCALEICNRLSTNPRLIVYAIGILSAKIQSAEEWEAVQALNLLDTCMTRCGSGFQMEVGKFRFLNEMIKLVSPKYLGNRTSSRVQHRVITLLHTWSSEFPQETKIKEAYDMLKKQGVIKEDPPSFRTCCEDPPAPQPRTKSSVFEDEEKSRLLQKLLRSKNPEDLQAANRLIKSMVREDERRVEQNSKRITELESVHNNVKLLSEMLDNYRPGHSSSDELELIKELHQSCERLRPIVFRLASETQDNEAMLNEVLHASDELGQVFDKYTEVIIKGNISQVESTPSYSVAQKDTSLLDLSTPVEEKHTVTELGNQLSNLGVEPPYSSAQGKPQSDIDVLGDIFSSLTSTPVIQHSEVSLLQPVSVQHNKPKDDDKLIDNLMDSLEKPSKVKALEDLDALGESLLKQNLPTSCKLGSQFNKTPAKIPMNQLNKPEAMWSSTKSEEKPVVGSSATQKVSDRKETATPSFDVNFLLSGNKTISEQSKPVDLLNGDDSMVDISESEVSSVNISSKTTNDNRTIQIKNTTVEIKDSKNDVLSSPAKKNTDSVRPLGDLFVPLESIKPGNIPPLTVVEERNGISVTLHFAKENPRPDVSVIVVTTISKNSEPITDFLFQAVVPKTCKLRLQPASSTELPAHNPFLPPAAITQVMLIASPSQEVVSLKFIISFTLDGETITEMGEVEKLPIST